MCYEILALPDYNGTFKRQTYVCGFLDGSYSRLEELLQIFHICITKAAEEFGGGKVENRLDNSPGVRYNACALHK